LLSAGSVDFQFGVSQFNTVNKSKLFLVHSELIVRVEKIDIVFAMQANSSVSACDSLRIVEPIVVKVDDGDFRKYVNSFEFWLKSDNNNCRFKWISACVSARRCD
jgi:hypothetical protein